MTVVRRLARCQARVCERRRTGLSMRRGVPSVASYSPMADDLESLENFRERHFAGPRGSIALGDVLTQRDPAGDGLGLFASVLGREIRVPAKRVASRAPAHASVQAQALGAAIGHGELQAAHLGVV